MKKNILIIKHGSFGDIILATGAFKTIKNYFPEHKIYLLTSLKYIDFIKKSPFFYDFIIDNRNPFYFFLKNFFLIKIIVNKKFEYIIDLQNSQRTFLYNIIFRIFTKSKISSSRPLAHYKYNIPKQGIEHVTEGLNNQLSQIGINNFFKPNIDWLNNGIRENIINKPYIIIIPGTSKKGIYKRWPSKNFGEISKFLYKKNYSILVVGNESDYEAALDIFNICPDAVNLLGKSPPDILYKLAMKSKFIISNDTGPAMLVSLTDKPLIWIVNDNNISLSNKPIGKNVYKVSANSIKNISVEQVKNKLLEKNLI